jgi:hypothetical protein
MMVAVLFLWLFRSTQCFLKPPKAPSSGYNNHKYVHKTTSTFFASSSKASFDFASPKEWDMFYQEQQRQPNPAVVEWHDSVPLEDIAAVVPPHGTCLMVGCGNSRLPKLMLERPLPPRELVLLDTSQACLDQLQKLYGTSSSSSLHNGTVTAIDYVCGDATQLSSYFCGDNRQGDKNDKSPTRLCHQFDIIVDKGLTDAILCSEGWDWPLERMFHEAAKVLTPYRGKYLLISYQLPVSTQEFLVQVGKQVGLQWEFGVSLSTLRYEELGSEQKHQAQKMTTATRKGHSVSVALATRI